MGDISEIRGMVVVGSFLGMLVLLMSLIPSGFLIADYEGRTVTTPEYFEAIDLIFYQNTVNVTLDDSGDPTPYVTVGYTYRFDLGGHNLRLYDYFSPSVELKLHHFWYWWIIETNHHWMEWLDQDGKSKGEEITPTELDADYSGGNIQYTIIDEHFTAMVFFGFNETTYSTPSDAWTNNDLKLLFAIEYDQVNTSVNAWSLISMLLFFQLPAIHWIINAIIAVPLWIAIAYISFILILRAIGAIFGGGA